MKGLIVLEGPDGGGKTTLAKTLCRMFKGRYLHATYRYKDNMFLYHTAILKHAVDHSVKQLVILDRSWPSESVYADIYRKGSLWPHMGRMMDRVIRKHAGIYVICQARTAGLHMGRFIDLAKKRREMYEPDQRMEDVWSLYNAMWSGAPFITPGGSYYDDILASGGMMNRSDSLRYSIEVEGESPRTLSKFIDKLVHRLVAYQQEQTPIGLDNTYHNFLGHVRGAKYLFVGDKLSDKRFNHVGWPFYCYSNSSLYLSEQLSAMGFNEGLACWTNANDEHGTQTVTYLTEEYGLKPIFFGMNALGKFTNHEMMGNQKFELIRHPQFYNRFEHNSGLLIEDLRKAFEHVSNS